MSFRNFRITTKPVFGETTVSLWIDHVIEDEDLSLYILYDDFINFMKQHFPEEYQYINTIRTQMGGYGTKEYKVISQLESEEFPLEKFVIKYWEINEDKLKYWIDFYEKLFDDPELMKKIVDKSTALQHFHNTFPSISNSEVLDEFEQHISKFWTEKYPEIIETDADDIRKFSEILSKYTLNFGMDMINHVLYIRAKLYED